MQPHLDLACAKLNNTQEELKISQDTTRNLAVRVTELEKQLDAFQTTLNSLSLRIDDDAGKKVNALENKVDTFQTQFGNVEGKVEKVLKVDVQPHLDLACAKLNNTQEELKISQDTTTKPAVRRIRRARMSLRDPSIRIVTPKME